MVKFTKTEYVLKTAEQFFNQFVDINTIKFHADIKRYLVDHIIIVFYSEAEENLESIMRSKWDEIDETNFSSFFTENDFNKCMRGIKKEIPLRAFDSNKLNISDKVIEVYKNFTNRRHDIAHFRDNPSEITWEEIIESESGGAGSIDKVGEEVLSEFERLLNT